MCVCSSHTRCTGCSFSATRHLPSCLRPGHLSGYSTVQDSGRTCVIGHPLGLLISDIGSSPRRWNQLVTWRACHRSTRWPWNLLLDKFHSFGARPLRLLSGARPPLFASFHLLLPLVVLQQILHAPKRAEYLSCLRSLGLGVVLLSAFVAHHSPENIRRKLRSLGCQSPLTSFNHTPYHHLDRSFHM